LCTFWNFCFRFTRISLEVSNTKWREPQWKPWVNSSAPEGWTCPDPPVAPEYITFTIRRMYIAQVQSNYRTFLQLIFIILTNSSYSSLYTVWLWTVHCILYVANRSFVFMYNAAVILVINPSVQVLTHIN
jgi:hypothetical protein